ncbi:MAG: ABC transporter permease [Halobacteria archaeon]|nr:ABC transporter permease [Halobacteria archaeon]
MGFKQVLTVARRELSSLRSEKTVVLALMIQLFIAAFSSFLVVGLVSMYSPDAVGDSGFTVDFGVTGDAADDVARAIDDEDGWRVSEYESYEAAMSEFSRGGLDVVLDTSRLENGRIEITAVVPDSSIRTTLIVVQAKQALQTVERSQRAEMSSTLERQPVPLPEKVGSSPYFGFTYTVLIPLLMFLPVFISGSISSDSITEEFERGTFDLLRTAPISENEIIDGKMAAMAVLSPVQAAVWLGLLRFNGTTVVRPFLLVTVVAAFSVITVTAGSTVALRFRDRKKAQFIYSVSLMLIFGALHLDLGVIPESPTNTVAKLAMGSSTPETYLMVAVYAVLAVVGYLAVRRGLVPSVSES